MADPVGCPTKYKESYCKRVIALMGKGYTQAMIAEELDINIDSLYEWAKKHKEFSDALRVGRQRLMSFMDRIGIKNMESGKFFNEKLYALNRRNMFREGDDSKVRIKGLVGKTMNEKTEAVYKAVQDGELSAAQLQSIMNGLSQGAGIDEKTETRKLLEKIEEQLK